jgi:tagaturonate reductase
MILQFGAGNFLRAFFDLFVAQANRSAETAVGKITVVQSTGNSRAEALNAVGCRYHVAIQGFQAGQVVNETELVDSLETVLHAGSQWQEVLSVSRHPELKMIVSNTTEAGFILDDCDVERGGVPLSFPAKLLDVLLTRYEAGLPAVQVIPCELIERNGEQLLELVLRQAKIWSASAEAISWLKTSCQWRNNLVDRIVPGPPREHELLGQDPQLLSAEPYAFWAVEGEAPIKHPQIVGVPDVTPYQLRKVRILNGAHTALVCHALPKGIKTVRECMENAEVSAWLEKLLFEEIVPVLEGRVEDPIGFARDTLDRFRNPYLEHQLSSIALNHEAKLKNRLLPTLADFRSRFGREPEILSQLLP